MPKPKDRGGNDPGGGNGGGEWSQMPNPYQIPNNLDDAIGEQGEPKSMVSSYWDVNPYYSPFYKEFSENCQRCVMAYEMNRRGYDVEALPTYEGDRMPASMNWATALKDMNGVNVGKKYVETTINSITRQMAKFGNGSRAIVQLEWGGSGHDGHVFNVEYKDGTLYAFDAQNNRSLTGQSLLKEYLHYAKLNTVQLWRTDNKEVADNMRYMVKKRG